MRSTEPPVDHDTPEPADEQAGRITIITEDDRPPSEFALIFAEALETILECVAA